MIRFFVLAYGEEFVNLYEKIALRSLLQPGNRVADAIVSLYSDEASLNRLADLSQPLGIVTGTVIVPQPDANDTQRDAFIEEIKLCVQQNATMVVVSPDNFWGGGSLRNALSIMGEQDVCLGIPHMRVDQEKFLNLPDGNIPNNQLVRLAMKYPHPSWVNADVANDSTNTFYTGISMKNIAEGLYSVTHLQPTCFVCRFNASDYAFFAENKGRGLFDHHWPSRLVESGRYRCVGSSDAAFIAELTPKESHNTELTPVNRANESKFCRTAPHIEANRNVVSIWRA